VSCYRGGVRHRRYAGKLEGEVAPGYRGDFNSHGLQRYFLHCSGDILAYWSFRSCSIIIFTPCCCPLPWRGHLNDKGREGTRSVEVVGIVGSMYHVHRDTPNSSHQSLCRTSGIRQPIWKGSRRGSMRYHHLLSGHSSCTEQVCPIASL
jgi:hypothetical protein